MEADAAWAGAVLLRALPAFCFSKMPPMAATAIASTAMAAHSRRGARCGGTVKAAEGSDGAGFGSKFMTPI